MNTYKRIDAIDILRGLALAGMLLVNNPGSWSNVYPPLLHAPWHGITPTDLVFPFFIFVVGAAMAYSFRTQIQTDTFNWVSIIKRSVLLIAIGICLSAIPFNESPSEWRLPGVLQRIGLAFFLVALALKFIKKDKVLLWVALLCLFGYWFSLMMYSNEPYSMKNNLVRAVDILILGESHLYTGLGSVFDPEGLFSTIPAAVTCLSGYLITRYLQNFDDVTQKLRLLLIVGLILIAAGILWSFSFPINKSLWTSSYVLLSSGIACLCLATIITAWDIYGVRFGLNALRIYGSNPLFLFVLAGVVARIMNLLMVEVSGRTISLKAYSYEFLASFLPAKLASLSFALIFCLVFYLVALLLFKRGIFIKV